LKLNKALIDFSGDVVCAHGLYFQEEGAVVQMSMPS